MTKHIAATALKYTMDREHEPVAEVPPGSRLEIETELTVGDMVHTLDEQFDPARVSRPFVNPATGPIAIEGANSDHVVVCTIEEIEIRSPGLMGLIADYGPFVDYIWRREVPGGHQCRVVDIRDGFVWFDEKRRIPVRPMVGLIGVAPLLGGIPTVDNGPHGGNMDVQEMGPGCRIQFPVAADGALFYAGDCHAVQGDGELPGLGATEVRTLTTVTLDVAAKPDQMVWPRFETEEHIGAVACAKPLEDAFRLSVEELVKWMVGDFDLTPSQALLLLGQVAEARCTQLANPKYTYVTKIPKRYL
jgi:amidase